MCLQAVIRIHFFYNLEIDIFVKRLFYVDPTRNAVFARCRMTRRLFEGGAPQ